MGANLDRSLAIEVMRGLGRRAHSPGKVYVTGGVCALLYGWRESTVDIDLRLDPEPRGVFEGIRDVKHTLGVNIELASPSDFVPALPNWRERSVTIDTFGQVEFLHYDFYTQALAKLSRSHERDLHDIGHMVRDGLVVPSVLGELFEGVAHEVLRYPRLDEDALREKVTSWIEEMEGTS